MHRSMHNWDTRHFLTNSNDCGTSAHECNGCYTHNADTMTISGINSILHYNIFCLHDGHDMHCPLAAKQIQPIPWSSQDFFKFLPLLLRLLIPTPIAVAGTRSSLLFICFFCMLSQNLIKLKLPNLHRNVPRWVVEIHYFGVRDQR